MYFLKFRYYNSYCDVCKKCYKTNRNLKRHYNSNKHLDALKLKFQPVVNELKEKFKRVFECKTCNKKYKFQGSLYNHYKSSNSHNPLKKVVLIRPPKPVLISFD